MPLAMHALLRLQPQVGALMINANRNLAAYESMGVPVWPDALADYPGPLAGFPGRAGALQTPYLVHRALRHACFPDRPGGAAGRGLVSATAPRWRWPPRVKTASCRCSRCSA
jgi:molybdopterin-guanine dinucleotide biosynthesis protein A